MPRGPRKRSNTDIYHIMLRGSNKQRIFHDKTDYQTFLEGLRKYNSLNCYHLFAYCLMPNHLHLLLREVKESEPIDKIMRRLGTWYVTATTADMNEAAHCLRADTKARQWKTTATS